MIPWLSSKKLAIKRRMVVSLLSSVVKARRINQHDADAVDDRWDRVNVLRVGFQLVPDSGIAELRDERALPAASGTEACDETWGSHSVPYELRANVYCDCRFCRALIY